eukprot:scaffold10566_cov198-Skeletonema_menzelii.AAC.3
MSGSSSTSNNELWQPWPDSALSMARTALSLTSQDWTMVNSRRSHGLIDELRLKAPTLVKQAVVVPAVGIDD